MIDTPFRQTRVPRLHTVRFSLALGSGQWGDRPEHTLVLWQSVSGSQVWPAGLNPQSWLQHRPWLGLMQRKSSIINTGEQQTPGIEELNGFNSQGRVGVPAHFPRFEAALNSSRLFGTEAAGVFIVTHVTLLIFLHNMVSTDGVFTYWPQGGKRSNTHYLALKVCHGIKNSHLQNTHPFSVVRARWCDRCCTERAYRCFHALRLRRVGTSGTGLCHHLIQGSRSLIPHHAETQIRRGFKDISVL